MDRIFVDTSAIYALIDSSDEKHRDATKIWAHQLVNGDLILLTTNYVVAESFDLIRRRLGFEALHALDGFVADTLSVHFVDEALHDAARRRVFSERRRALSLVDCASIEFGRQQHVRRAFAFDKHLGQGAFDLLSP